MVMNQGFRVTALYALFISALALSSFAGAFDANGDSFDGNFQSFGYSLADSNVAGGTFEGDFVSPAVTTGSWHGGGLYFREGVYFDQNKVGVIITAPASGSSFASSSVTLTYNFETPGNPVKIFWVQVDSNGWINNRMNLSRDFNGLANGDHTFYVVATDLYDVNSLTKSVAFSVSVSSGASTTSSTVTVGTPPGGGVGSGGTPRVAIDDVENQSNVLKTYEYAGSSGVSADGIEVTRSVSNIVLDTSAKGRTNVWGFDVVIKNNSDKPFQNVSVVETIPKKVAANVSEVTFKVQPARIIKADPIVEWIIEDLPVGGETKFFYFVEKLRDKGISDDYNAFFASQPVPELTAEEKTLDDACRNVNCDDNNICTQDSCSQGVCSNVPAREGITCSEGSVCKLGNCVAPPKPTKAPSGPEKVSSPGKPFDFGSLLVPLAGIIVLIIAVAALFFFKIIKKPSK